MKFWTKVELEREFHIEASFYQLEVNNELYLCRNKARIVRRDTMVNSIVDAIVIMVNPGSCIPSVANTTPTLKRNFENAPFVKVHIDPTQQQLMRLMKKMSWNHLTIINLSDLCAGNMTEFQSILKKVEAYPNHSIFSEERTDEREKVLNESNRIILAWGQNSLINPLACNALEKLRGKEVYGMPGDKSFKYRHPFPFKKESCIKWLQDISKQVMDQDAFQVKKII